MACLALATSPAFPQEFRTLRPIMTPSAREPLPAGAQRVDGAFIPIDRRELERTIGELVAKWNTPEFASTLAETFFDRTRLEDAVNTDVPRDARLRLLSLEGVQTLDQHVIPDPSGLPIDTVVSTVSATVRAQAEFKDASNGFQRQEGFNELILRISQRMLR
jgi:hypothetical protein